MAAGKRKAPPPLPEGEDRKARAFRARAAPILAQHGGINAESELKLRVLATELGLSDEEFHRAMASSHGPAATHPGLTPEEQERLRRFSKNILRSLRKQRRDVLTPQIEQTLVEAGRDRYGLPEELARSTVRQAAAENGIRSISKTEARQFVADLVRQRVGDSGWISHGVRQRAYREGKQWGLTHDEVTELISRHATAVRRSSWLGWIVLCLAMLSVFAVGGLMAWLFVRLANDRPGNQPEGPPSQEVVEEGPGGEGPSADPSAAQQESPWWDMDLAVALGRARKALPGFLPVLEAVESADPQRRATAYEDLAGRLTGGLDDEVGRRVLEEILAGCYALDPSEPAATRLREALLSAIPANGSELPEEDAAYQRYLWVVATAVTALHRPGLPAARADALAVALGQTVGAAVDRALDPDRLQRDCYTALIKRCYRMLIALAAAEPGLAPARRTALMIQADYYLQEEARQRLDVEFLAAVLPGPGDRWRDYHSLIRECIESPDPLNALRMVEIYEQSNNPKLQAHLRNLLLQRSQIRTESKVPGEVAQQVRDALGASLNPGDLTPADRWRLLASRVRRATGATPATADEPEKLLDETVELTALSTLACALAQKELGYATFDQLNRAASSQALPQPSVGPPVAPSGSRRALGSYVSPAAMGEIKDLVYGLAAFKRLDTGTRIHLVASLARFSGQVPDLTPQQGAAVAEYLLSAKPEQEQKRIAEHLQRVGRWRSVRLGLADEVVKSPLSKQRAVELVSGILGRQLALGDEENWKAAIRWVLLKDVLDELPETGPGRGSQLGRKTDEAAQTIGDHLATQAQLLGIPAEQYKAAATPSARLRLLIDRYAAGLARKRLRAEDQAYLAGLPYQLTAAEYLRTDDLARTVLLDRIWLRLLGADAVQQAPGRAADADRIAADLAQRDGQATSLLVQLRDGQRAILETWMLQSDAK